MFSDIFNKFYGYICGIKFDTLVYFILGSYLAVFLIALIATLCSAKFKLASKKPFLCLTNAYAAVTLAAFLSECDLAQSLTAAVTFWVIGYILYGALCAFNKRYKAKKERIVQSVVAATPVPVQPIRATRQEAHAQVPAAKNGVRLEHAVAVTDNLLTKNLAKSDRQELEKLKNTLSVLKIKGTLNPTEADILNDNFNALLKLMAKYNV